MVLSSQDILELAGEQTLEDVRELNLRGQRLDSFESHASLLPNLLALSLSHNLLSSLKGFHHLIQLQSLNLNFNSLTSLEGAQSCISLQHLYVANNMISDLAPLSTLICLRTVSLFRNSITSLDSAIAVLSGLPSLSELDLGGNPCSLVPDYKSRMVLVLSALSVLDGDSLTELDRDMAAESMGWIPEVTQELDAASAMAEEAAATNAGTAAAAADMMFNMGPMTGYHTQNDTYHQEVTSTAGGGTADVLTVHHSTEETREDSDRKVVMQPEFSTATQADRKVVMQPEFSTATQADRKVVMQPEFSTATQDQQLGSQPHTSMTPSSSNPSDSLPKRPTTASNRLYRPGTAQRPGTASAWHRPSTTSERPCTSSARVASNEFLNDNPLLLEYLAKHVLQEGLALMTAKQQESSGVQVGRASSANSSTASGSHVDDAGGSSGRAASLSARLGGSSSSSSSFVTRLRGTAAVNSAWEGQSVKEIVASGQPVVSGQSVIEARSVALQSSLMEASPQEIIRQLVRLCEVLIREVETAKLVTSTTGTGRVVVGGGGGTGHTPSAVSSWPSSATTRSPQSATSRIATAPPPAISSVQGAPTPVVHHNRPSSATEEYEAATSAQPASATSAQPASATSAQSPSVSTVTAASGRVLVRSSMKAVGSGAEDEEKDKLKEEVLRLTKEVKQLKVENQNIYWLAEEYKVMKAELQLLRQRGEATN